MLILKQRELNMMKIFISKYMNRLNLLTSTGHAGPVTASPLEAQLCGQISPVFTAQEILHV
jgi:hypothetical protein